MVTTFEAAPGIVGIDTMLDGRAQVTSAYLIRSSEPTLVETGPTTSLGAVLEGLGSLGVDSADLAHVIVTHIHLDHAGAVGTLSARFPRATIWTHERGAPHLADPAKLVASAERVYGADTLGRLFGPVDPVPAERLRTIADALDIRIGDRTITALHTPGHASHHVALVDSETGAVFTGDALGIHLPDVGVLRPATPPPDIDVELSLRSIETIRSRAETVLMFSHYGPVDAVEELCEIAARRLQDWSAIVGDAMRHTDDLDRVAQILSEQTSSELAGVRDGIDVDRYELLSSMRINAAGLMRYWRKRAEAGEPTADAGSAAGEPVG